MKKLIFIILFFLFFPIISFAENTQIKETLIYENYSNMGDVVSSFDGSSISFSAKKKGGFVIVKDGNEIGQEYYEILYYSYSDNSIYYIANKSYKGEYILLKDGNEILSINSKPKELYTSKIGGKYAINLGDRLIINGKNIGEFDKINNFFFSQNGDMYGFEYNGGININGKNILGNYKKVYGFTGSLYGDHYSYIAKKNNGNIVVVNNGIEGKEYKDIYKLFYSRDGNNIAYVAQIDYNRSLVVLNNQELNINSKLISDFSDLVFSKDNDLFYRVKDKIYKNNLSLSEIDSNWFRSLIISNNGEQYSYSYRSDSKSGYLGGRIVVVNGKEIISGKEDSDFTFSPNNNDYAFIINKGYTDANIIKNGKKITGYDTTYSPLFLDDGTFAFIGEKNNERYLVINEKEQEIEKSGNYSGIYSLDGKNIIYWIGDGAGKNKKIEFFYLENKDFFAFTDDIASPKNVSKDPIVIGVNGILALLYLMVFYFIFQLFSFYSDKLLNSDKIDNKISHIINRIISYIFNIFYSIGGKINIKYTNKIREILLKYEHKIYVILGLIILGIIGQIGISTFDIYSINGLLTIIIMLFILGIIIFLKNILLYLYTKKDSKDNLKIENSPIGYILAIIILNIGNYFGMIPNLILSNTINLKTKTNIAYRKISKPSLLLNISYILFFIGFIFWYSTKYFSSGFTYKFIISTYFLIINDLFFTLLPFSAFWGFYILRNSPQTKNSILKIKWFILIFIVGFLFLHTILNPNINGDYKDLLQFKGNFKILVYVLLSLIIITGFLYFIDFYFRKKKISKTINS